MFDIVTGGDQSNGQLAAMRLDDGKVIPLELTGRNPRYVSTGHILFARLDGTVIAAPFDAARLRVTGPALTNTLSRTVTAGGRMIAAGIATSPAFTVTSRTALFADRFRGGGATASYDVSRDGKSFLMAGNSSDTLQRVVVVKGWLDELRERTAQAVR